MMMHTHILHRVIFQNDIASSVRYKDLAGLTDFPLAELYYTMRHIKKPEPYRDVVFGARRIRSTPTQ